MNYILYTVGLDKNGALIKAQDAEKGGEYFCPFCSSGFILRKSGKIGKGSKRPHFAHRAVVSNCSPESALHYLFKTMLVEYIQNCILSGKPIHFSWTCDFCGEEHKGNLLKKVKTVKVEYALPSCKPDIALLCDDNLVICVIEVVVTHNPEENSIKYYQDNNIVLIQLNLNSDNDIFKLQNIICNPNKVFFCVNPKCKTCGSFQ